MSTYPNSASEVKHVCAQSGYELQTIDTVRKGVYQGILTNGMIGYSDKVYIKINPLKNKPELERFSAIAVDAGHPPCEIIEADNYVCLVMGTAPGRSLSKLLPAVFLPVVWSKKSNHYRRAFHQIGRQLAWLHTNTDQGMGPVLDEREREKALNKTRLIEDRVANSTVNDIRTIFREYGDIPTQYAITYGDCSPHNLFFDGETVTHIDASCKIRCVEYEHRGVIMGVNLMARRLPYSSAAKGERLINAYWSGYEQESQTEQDDRAYLVRYLYGALKMLSTYESPKTIESRLTRWTDVPILVDEIQKAADEITNMATDKT